MRINRGGSLEVVNEALLGEMINPRKEVGYNVLVNCISSTSNGV